jgi:hypothetical protein
MVYTFIKAVNTAAVLYILNIINAKNITLNNNQCHTEVIPEKLTVAQLLIHFLV